VLIEGRAARVTLRDRPLMERAFLATLRSPYFVVVVVVVVAPAGRVGDARIVLEFISQKVAQMSSLVLLVLMFVVLLRLMLMLVVVLRWVLLLC
jgi:hypothetical protein